jgi:hypothetical protein
MKGLPDVEPFPDGRMGDGVERFLSAVIPVDRSRTRDSKFPRHRTWTYNESGGRAIGQ